MDVGSHFVPFSPIYAPQFHLYAEIWANLLLIRISLLPHSHLLNGCSSQRVRRRKGLYEHYGISLQTKGRERERKKLINIYRQKRVTLNRSVCAESRDQQEERRCVCQKMTYRGVDISIQKRERGQGEKEEKLLFVWGYIFCAVDAVCDIFIPREEKVLRIPSFNRFFFHKKKEEEVIHFPSQSPIRIEALRKKKIFDFFLSDLSSIKRGINNNSSSRAAMECVCPLC